MPLALDPNQTFTIVLESDKDKSADKQPCFIYRYITGRQWRKVACLQEEIENSEFADAVVDKVYEAAATGLVGWKNMVDPAIGQKIPFDVKKLEDVIGVIEAQELILKLMKQHPSLDDKKKSDSQSGSSTAKSAKRAKVRKNAETNHQK